MPSSRYIGALLAPAAVLASRLAIPSPTAKLPLDPVEGFSPRITSGPQVERAVVDLQKRYVDYGHTCGFVNGDLESALTCLGTYICATNTILDVAGCCDPRSLDSCYLYTSCIPSSQLASCTAANCLLDQAVAKCTDAAAPYCVDWQYDYITTTLAGYGCDVSAFTGVVEYTYSGQATFDISSYLTSIPEFSLPTVFVTQTLSSSDGFSGSSTSSTSSSSSGDDDSKKVPIGAIVGGVIGGLGALSILGALLICLFFKRRRDKRNAAAQAAFHPAQPNPPLPQHQQQQQQPPPPPMPYSGGPNDYKPPPPMAGVPQMQQQQQHAAGNPPPQNFSYGNVPPPLATHSELGSTDVKYEYSSSQQQQQQGMQGSMTPVSPYSPPVSPSPMYTPSPPPPMGQMQQHQQQQWNPNVAQIDGTPVFRNSEGRQVHEAP